MHKTNKYKLWWKFEGKYMFRNLVQGVKNLIHYFPIIWKDRDWDYRYTLDILEYKLKRQRNYINKNKRFVGYEFVVRDLNICLSLLDKFKEEYYSMEKYEYLEKKHRFVPTDETEKYFTMESDILRNDLEQYFKKYPKIHEKFKHLEKDERIAMEMGYYLQAKANRLFFKILETKIQSWWD